MSLEILSSPDQAAAPQLPTLGPITTPSIAFQPMRRKRRPAPGCSVLDSRSSSTTPTEHARVLALDALDQLTSTSSSALRRRSAHRPCRGSPPALWRGRRPRARARVHPPVTSTDHTANDSSPALRIVARSGASLSVATGPKNRTPPEIPAERISSSTHTAAASAAKRQAGEPTNSAGGAPVGPVVVGGRVERLGDVAEERATVGPVCPGGR